jgi:hypothetical protein
VAKETSARFGKENVSFVHTNRIDSLREVARFDVLFSIVVLQHNPPPVIRHVLNVLLSRINSGGVGYFQLPTYRFGYSFDAEKYLATPPNLRAPEMHVLPQQELHALLEERGCRLIEIREDSSAGGDSISSRVLIQKK